MVHARVVRPPSSGAKLLDLDTAAVSRMPGVVAVIRDGNYLAVVAREEFQAVQAMRTLANLARWQEQALLPPQNQLAAYLVGLEAQDAVVIEQRSDIARQGSRTFEAKFTRAYQCHASIGPSCALAWFEQGTLTVWTHTQGVFPDRAAIAEMLHLPEEAIRCIHVEGSGAMDITAPMMPPPMRRCSRAHCRACRFECSGCASRNISMSRTVLQW